MFKKSINLIIFKISAIFFIVVTINKCFANDGLTVGETIPNPEIMTLNKYELDQMPRPVRIHDYKADKIMLVAFMPSIKENNSYAKVMTTAFDTYFAEALAFIKGYTPYVKPGELKVLVVTNNSDAEVNEYLRKLDLDFDMVSDKNQDVSHFFGVTIWNTENDGSLVYVVDKDNKITYANYDYKGEGEKLKFVQKELYTLYGIEDNSLSSSNVTEYPALMPGDNARDFGFEYVYMGLPTAGLKTTEHGKLSDYLGSKNVLIAFYPAPFSYSCAVELSTFDTYAEEKTLKSIVSSNLSASEDVEILMVSNSNSLILSKWKNEMGLKNVKLVSDITGEISAKYKSFSLSGYNKRTVFLINKEGKVTYIDWDYQVNDEDFAEVKKQISSLN